LLETAEAQVQLDAALDAGDADRALTIAAGTPDLLRCDKINNAWRIAKAQELQQQTQAAVDTYRAVISACTSYADITASLEKSASAASDEGLTSLFDLALSRFPANAADLGSLKTRLMEGRGTVAPIPEPAIRIEAQPDATMRPKARVPQVAAPEPRSAPPAAVSSGVGSSSGCLASTNGATSAARQVQRGWCAYDLDRPMEALAAFKEAESRLSGSQKRDARFGMALSYLKLNMTEEASRIAATTELTAKQRVDTESIILDQRGVRAFQKKQYRQAIGYFDALEQISGRLRRDLALLRGYAYLNTGNRSKAQELFRTLHNQLATTESRNALAASQ
jgi:tetratricopeptide (TPR) repeat protein